ncbi:hypothetical protein C8J56DRAFT_920960 [Mycena floridula]|nr:hypothetical protein C8J56DRAFT_920960 [Mycena floridula]
MLVQQASALSVIAPLGILITNKWVLNTAPAPLFYLFAHFTVVTLLFGMATLEILSEPLTFRWKVCKQLVSAVSLNIGIPSLGIYALKHLQLSFYQVVLGLSMPFAVFFSSLTSRTRPSIRILSTCGLIALGFLIGIYVDTFSFRGIAFGITYSALTVLQPSIIKSSLPFVDGSPVLLMWYTNVLW